MAIIQDGHLTFPTVGQWWVYNHPNIDRCTCKKSLMAFGLSLQARYLPMIVMTEFLLPTCLLSQQDVSNFSSRILYFSRVVHPDLCPCFDLVRFSFPHHLWLLLFYSWCYFSKLKNWWTIYYFRIFTLVSVCAHRFHLCLCWFLVFSGCCFCKW